MIDVSKLYMKDNATCKLPFLDWDVIIQQLFTDNT